MNLLEGGKGGEGRMGERGWGGDGGRVGREGGEGTWGREGGWGEREGEGERGRVGREGGWGEREGGEGGRGGEGRGGMTVILICIHIVIGLYRENAIAIESEARDPFGGNVYYVTMQITFHIPEFARKERKLHCDVVHVTTKLMGL